MKRLNSGLGPKFIKRPIFHVSSAKIVHDLSLIGAPDCARCLDFDDNLIVHDDVGAELSNHLTPKVYSNWELPIHMQPRVRQGNQHCLFIHRFKKSMAKLVVHLIKDTDDFLCYFLMLHFFVIRVNPCDPWLLFAFPATRSTDQALGRWYRKLQESPYRDGLAAHNRAPWPCQRRRRAANRSYSGSGVRTSRKWKGILTACLRPPPH